MSDNHSVHILLPTYNVAPYISSTLSSILAQNYTNLTALIVDDGSTDSTRQIIQRFSLDNPSFKVIFDNQHKGIAARRDQLVDLSKEIDPDSYFLWIDGDDTITDPNFISCVIDQMVRTRADICLYNFDIRYETDSPALKANAAGLLKEKETSEAILSHVVSSHEQVVSVETYPAVATYTSLGWTKAYAPSAKVIWPSSDHRYIYEDFAYMAALFRVERITALEPDFKPICYLRRTHSATGHRVPAHFYEDIIRQLKKFKGNTGILSPEKEQAARQFISNKLLQYDDLLRTLIDEDEFLVADLVRFRRMAALI